MVRHDDSGGELREVTLALHDRLFDGVEEVVYAAFPDHGNVGDSAIALGMLRYLSLRGISVRYIHSVGADPRQVCDSAIPVLLQGGGNLGGLYPYVDRYRDTIVQSLPRSTLVIQAPQSVHFVDPAARAALESGLGSRPNTRIAVRDAASAASIESFAKPLLVPDSVHLLGAIESTEPDRPVVVLARRDIEAVHERGADIAAVDWLSDEWSLSVSTKLRWQMRHVGLAAGVFGLPTARWRRVAERRLARGVRTLSPGEVIITDRLHAVLIALQMGRRVIAVDNANHKLSRYFETWWPKAESGGPALAASFPEAIVMAR